MQHFDRLFRAAEVEAEALIGIARMLVATILGLAAFILIQRVHLARLEDEFEDLDEEMAEALDDDDFGPRRSRRSNKGHGSVQH